MAYSPTTLRPGQNPEDWIHGELRRISAELNALVAPQILLSPQAAAPEKPRDGMVAHADGTNWNPGGTGKGLYLYSTNTWIKL